MAKKAKAILCDVEGNVIVRNLVVPDRLAVGEVVALRSSGLHISRNNVSSVLWLRCGLLLCHSPVEIVALQIFERQLPQGNNRGANFYHLADLGCVAHRLGR